jgi:hypothetical protein
MDAPLNIQGRVLTPADLDLVRGLISAHPDWHRTRLSRELCAFWNWIDRAGRLKDMACRTMLLKLHRRGLLELPAARGKDVNHCRGRRFQPTPHDTSPLHCSLSDLGEIRLVIADAGSVKQLWRTLLHCHHYLGFSTKVGKSVSYLGVDASDRPVAALLFGAAAWKTAPRDAFIGWNVEQRRNGLELIANNMRFLIPPWVRVPHLASHVLGLAARRVAEDWQVKYGHPVVLLETFVEKARFRGTCYKAANWIYVGDTVGRTRNDAQRDISVPVKAVYALPLRRDFRKHLIRKE